MFKHFKNKISFKVFNKTYLLITIIFFTLTYNSCSKIENNNNDKYFEEIINNNIDITDSASLRLNFNHLQQESDNFRNKEYLDVIYKVLLAKIKANEFDRVNSESYQLFEEALNETKSINQNDLYVWVYTNYGFYFYTYSEYTKALPYFLLSAKILDEEPNEELFLANEILKKNAYYFGAVNDFDKEIRYLKRALETTPNQSIEYANILNAIGHHYYKVNNLDKAKDYFIKSMVYSKKNEDINRYAKSLGDIALVYKAQENYTEAIKYLKDDISISKQNNQDKNTMYAQILLGKIYLKLGDLNNANTLFNDALNYASQKKYLQSYVLEINQLLLEIAIQEKNDTKELELRRKLSVLENDLSNSNGADVISSINWQVQKENFNYKLEAESARAEKESIANKMLILISILLLLSILFLVYNYRKRLKIQKSDYENIVLKLQVDKLKSEKKLGLTHKTLNSYKTYLSEKNNQIEDLKFEMNNIKGSKISYLEEKQGELNKLLNSHLMTEENWLAFKQTFINEKYEYYQFLMANFPKLTDSNLRIIFLQKLGLSNSETAQLLGVTIDAIKKAKQRLRKKYQENYDHLFKYED